MPENIARFDLFPPAPGEYHARMSLAPNAVTMGDVLAATAIYIVPFRGNTFSVWDGFNWKTIPFTTFTMPVPAVANQHYDVYLFLNPNAITLGYEFIPWTSDTVRSVPLTTKDGAVVKTGDPRRKYIGSIRTLLAGQTEDSEKNRLVRNHATFVKRTLGLHPAYTGADTLQTINVTSTVWAPINGGVDSTVRYLANSEGPLDVTFSGTAITPAPFAMSVGIGNNSTTTALRAAQITKNDQETFSIRENIQQSPGCYTVTMLARMEGGTGQLITNHPFGGGTIAPFGTSLDGSIGG